MLAFLAISTAILASESPYKCGHYGEQTAPKCLSGASHSPIAIRSLASIPSSAAELNLQLNYVDSIPVRGEEKGGRGEGDERREGWKGCLSVARAAHTRRLLDARAHALAPAVPEQG